MSLNQNIDPEEKKEKIEKNEEEDEEEDSEFETIKQNNISIYKLLYPPIKESFIQDENNTINNKILKLKEDLPLLRYKKSSKTNKNFKIDEEISLMSNDEEEDLKMTDEFLADLIKVPCPISKTKIIAIVSNFIRKSKLIGKLESEYQSDKKADLNNLSVLCAEHLTYKELKKGEVIFKIGEFGNRFYFILKGFISILKLKEKSHVIMSYNQYYNYCIKLYRENETYILEETLKKNDQKIPFGSIENLLAINKIIFRKKLYENLNKDLLSNTKLLLSFFDINEQNLEHFNIHLDVLQNFELTKNHKDWKSYLIKKIKPSKEDIEFFDKYNRFVNSKSELYVTCFCYDPFLYLGPGFFFGDSALDKGNIYTGGKRNATIRAETEVIIGWLKSVDYLDMIEPKRRLEKLKEVSFLFNNFFFQEISIHLFDKNYFHLFSAREYSRGEVLFSTGQMPRALFFIKEGKISIELKTSIANIQKLIRYLYEYIFTNPLFMNLSRLTQKKILTIDIIKVILKYINDPIFKNLRGYSQKFIDELNKDRKFNIAFLGENEIIGLQEIFLGVPYIMKGIVHTTKLFCYEIGIEHIQKILYNEKPIIIPYIKSSINKILSLIERIQNIKEHYINAFIHKYEKAIYNEKVLNSNISTSDYNINNYNNKNYILKTDNSESNINNIKKNIFYENINKTIANFPSDNNNCNYNYNNYNIIEINNISNILNTNKAILSDNLRAISIPDNKSPLKNISYLKESKKLMTKLKKNRKISCADNCNIKAKASFKKNKIKSRNLFNRNNKFQFPDIQKNKELAKTAEKVKSFFDVSTKNKDDVLIGNKYFSIEKLKNKFKQIYLLNNNNKELVQIIQSTKYKNNINSSRTNIHENKKEPILKGKQNFLNYHLSFIPLYNFNDNKNKESINDITINKNYCDSLGDTNTITPPLTIPYLSQYSSKESTKYNSFGKKKHRSILDISNNNFGNNLKMLKSFSENKDISITKSKNILSYCSHKVNNNEIFENEKYKGNIKEKIKDFYKDIKSKGCLSFLSNAQNNTFFMRKFNKKYISAIKKNFSHKDRINKGFDVAQKKYYQK